MTVPGGRLRLRLLDGVSDPAHDPNEDLFGSTTAAAWILDGASNVSGRDGVAAVPGSDWLVALADACFRRVLASAEPSEYRLHTALRTAITTAADQWQRLGADQHEEAEPPPSAAAGLVEVVGTTLRYLVLGDVSILVRDADQLTVIHDDAGSRQEQQFARQHGPRSPTRPGVDSLLAERRRREMNTDGGYWILSTDPRAADEARSGTVHVQPGTEILLMTDGFSRLVDTFAQPPDWLALLDPIAAGRPLMDEVSRLRRIEQSDPTGTRWPRLSVSDDASALFARVVAETDSEVHNVS